MVCKTIRMRNKIFAAVLLMVIGLAWSCKKDSTEESKPYLEGIVLVSDAPTYVAENCVIEVSCSIESLTVSTGDMPEEVGLYWMVNSGKRDTLTTNAYKSNPTYHATIEDAGTYVITCYAYGGDKYYSTSASMTVTAVNPDTALSGISGEPDVEIGGNLYRTFTAGGLTWMGGNLYGTEEGSSYEDSEIVDSLFGQYYSWNEANNVCPEGWHLPSGEEFDACLGDNAGALMVNASFVNVTMWEYWPEVPITNSMSFNAIPVGYKDFTLEDGPEKGFKEYAAFWTSDDDGDLGVFRYIYERSPMVMAGRGHKDSLAMSVRCVKD